MSDLVQKSCKPLVSGEKPLTKDHINSLLTQIDGWTADVDCVQISKTFRFRNYYETIAFVNSSAWIAHQEDHHPDLEVSYNRCLVKYSTHSIGGISENDFICAAKIEALITN